jgi:hypothetical protein
VIKVGAIISGIAREVHFTGLYHGLEGALTEYTSFESFSNVAQVHVLLGFIIGERFAWVVC